eukprot:XP_017946244.1 PREDICTED: uncharacterized protein LOC101734395 isoform X1 [Xenopus tropicalis]
MKTKAMEAKFHEEKLRLQQKHDADVQKILDRKNSETEELKELYRTKQAESEETIRKLEKKGPAARVPAHPRDQGEPDIGAEEDVRAERRVAEQRVGEEGGYLRPPQTFLPHLNLPAPPKPSCPHCTCLPVP